MLIYSVRAIILGGVLTLLARRSGGFNTYQLFFAPLWTVAVIAIRFRYGFDQIYFYTNDQAVQLALVNSFSPTNLSISLTQIINDRYVVVIPAWLLKQIGIEPVLALKFIQALCLTFIYKLTTECLAREGITERLWHVIFFSGPLLIFISTLGLRDLPLALFTTYFMIGRSPSLKIVALGLSGLLRPHLAVALTFGWAVHWCLSKIRLKRPYLAIVMLTVSTFFLGGLAYFIGGFFKYRLNIAPPVFFAQEVWWRFFANLVGLQFLTFRLEDAVVYMSTAKLLALRLLFVDTFAVPILFLCTLLNQSAKLSNLRIQVYASFVFFLGLVAQTNFNSSRQNLPFFPAMGVLALIGILKTDNSRSIKSLPTIRENTKTTN